MKRILFAVAAGLTLVGCGAGANDERGRGDAPVGEFSDAAADIINMPDGYGNVATKCNPYQIGTRIYVVTHGKTDTQPLVVQDPTCGPIAR